jgi:tellurite resistance protein
MKTLEDLDRVARLVVRIGFVVAGSDGLSSEERDHLMEYAATRSGLSKEIIEEEIVKSAAGLNSITSEEYTLLRQLSPEKFNSLLREVAEKGAAADGVFSELEKTTLNFVRNQVLNH